jgi:hypothetical protein
LNNGKDAKATNIGIIKKKKIGGMGMDRISKHFSDNKQMIYTMCNLLKQILRTYILLKEADHSQQFYILQVAQYHQM